MQTALQKYLAHCTKNLFDYLHDFDSDKDAASLHDLRVEIKKLRAIIKFLQQIYPKQKLRKASHNLRSVFQASGEIREYQLLQQWLSKYEFNAIEQTYFPSDKLKQIMQQFQKRLKGYKNNLEKVINKVEDFVGKTKEIFAEQYFTELNADLEQLCKKDLPATGWHELRKLIKQRIYAYNWITHKDSNDDKSFSYYNKLQEQIGQWHDLEIIKDAFSQKQIFLSQNLEVHKDFSKAWEKLTAQLKQKEKQIEESLSV
ncbi:MAG: CHAD domain-containing protein [Chitinophagaceae bacterium]